MVGNKFESKRAHEIRNGLQGDPSLLDQAEVLIHERNKECVAPDEVRNSDGPPNSTRRRWPDPPPQEAFYGVAGDLVRTIDPHTEADRVAVLTQFLVGFGNLIGRNPYFEVDAARHGTNLYVVLVGKTSKGRKGTSFNQSMRTLQSIDPDWYRDRIQGGLSTGEGLIWLVHDPVLKHEPIREGKRVVGYQDIEIDPGISDKRLLGYVPEFAFILQVLNRLGNTLSPVLRQAWDTGTLRSSTKNSPAVATNAHVSLVAHITYDELIRYLDSTEQANGFANRFLWVCVKRSKCLPDDEDRRCDAGTLTLLCRRIQEAVAFGRSVGEIKRDDKAREAWRKLYPELSEGKPGMLGAILARAEAQVMRLACIYALLDSTDEIKLVHLKAATALWEYIEASANFIFGNSLGDPTADHILDALRQAPSGMSRTEILNLFSRHRSSDVDRALTSLAERGIVKFWKEGTNGRPIQMWAKI